jgi:uncharacterized membrane protein
MRWNRWYGLKSYFSSALWIVPLVALVLENVVIRIVFGVQEWLEWVPWFGTTSSGAAQALNTVETLTISFIVFTFGSILIAIQVASGQLSPRIIATVAAAEQCHPVCGRTIHLHHAVRRGHRGQDRRDSLSSGRNH